MLHTGCWNFMSWEYLWSFQDEHQLGTTCIHDNFIVLHHWETRLPAPWPNISCNDIEVTTTYPLMSMPSAKRYEATSINCIRYWFDSTGNWTSEWIAYAQPIPQLCPPVIECLQTQCYILIYCYEAFVRESFDRWGSLCVILVIAPILYKYSSQMKGQVSNPQFCHAGARILII